MRGTSGFSRAMSYNFIRWKQTSSICPTDVKLSLHGTCIMHEKESRTLFSLPTILKPPLHGGISLEIQWLTRRPFKWHGLPKHMPEKLLSNALGCFRTLTETDWRGQWKGGIWVTTRMKRDSAFPENKWNYNVLNMNMYLKENLSVKGPWSDEESIILRKHDIEEVYKMKK